MKKIEHQPPKNTIKSKPFDSTINKKSSILPLILVFCIPVFLYLQTLKFGLTYFDDNKIITNHVDFLSHFGNSIKVFQTDAFMADKGHFYRPLQTLSYMTDIQLSGGDNAMDVSFYEYPAVRFNCLFDLSVAQAIFNTFPVSLAEYIGLLHAPAFCIYHSLDTGQGRFIADSVLFIIVFISC